MSATTILKRNVLDIKYALVRLILNTLPEKFIARISRNKAKSIARKTWHRTKAYAKFVGASGKGYSAITTFATLPVMDKESYIKKYPLEELVCEPISRMFSLESSSGYSGKRTYWPSFKNQEKAFVKYTQQGLVTQLAIHKKKTLIINTFLLGAWVTGEKLSRVLKQISNKDAFNLTVISPGLNLEETLDCITTFSPEYDQVVVFGYPPFLKKVFESLPATIFHDTDISIVSGGEGFPEQWRDYIVGVIQKLGAREITVVSAYGSADTGLGIGYETPFTIKIRNILKENKHLLEEIVGKDIPYLPTVFQYNPLEVYLESVNENLIFTKYNGVPLVRYDLKDKGIVVPFSRMKELLWKYNIDIKSLDAKYLKLPLIILFGRADGTISVNGTNIFIESIHEVMNSKDLAHLHTGNYSLKKDDELGTRLVIEVEVNDNLEITDEELNQLLQDKVTDYLKKKYKAYDLIYKENPEANKPLILLRKPGEIQSKKKKSIKNRYIQ